MPVNDLARLAVLLDRHRIEPDLPANTVAADAVMLRRIGRAALRHAVRSRNDPAYTERKQDADTRSLAGRINKLAERYSITRSDFGHDCRGGFALSICFADTPEEIPL